MYMFCRYGLAYVLHRLPAVANIIMTSEYLHFTQQIMASHDRAIQQAEMDVSPAMGKCEERVTVQVDTGYMLDCNIMLT